MDVERTYARQKSRGKLYALSAESAWKDTGTGYVTITGSDENRRLIFRDEESGEVIHDRPLFSRDTYQLQGEGERQTIIVWEDPEEQKDWALSLEDADGAQQVWETIRKEPGVCPVEERQLPLPSLGTLEELARKLTCVAPFQREALANECMAPKFIADLRECFHTAEDLSSEEALNSLWKVAKGIFLLSSQKCTERYLRHDVYEDIMGMLEYDEGLLMEKRILHRQVLKVKVRYQQVLNFEDADTLDRIHLNYRLQYLKDIVLPRILDDGAFVSLTQMIHSNVSTILDHLQKNGPLFQRLFQQIQQKDVPSLMFLQDVCRVAKQIVPGERQALYEKMMEYRMFEVLTPFLGLSAGGGGAADSEPSLHPPRHLAVEILMLSALNDPSHLRRFLTREGSAVDGPGRLLLDNLIQLMRVEVDQGVQQQIAETLRFVMDPTILEQRERDSCLDVFYEDPSPVLVELAATLRVEAVSSSRPLEFAQQLTCELFAFAVTNHGYRARVFVMRHGLAQQVARLMTSPHRFLQLAPVRFVRAMVFTKDDAYLKYIIKSGLMGPLMRNLHQSLAPPAIGNNLLVSATLELLEFIRIQNVKVLVDHLARKHVSMLREHGPKCKTLEGLMLKHQQNLEYEAFPPDQHASGGPITRSGGGCRGSTVRSPGRADSDDDEAYFESLDDDEDESRPSAGGVDAGSAKTTPGLGEGDNVNDGSTRAIAGEGSEMAQGDDKEYELVVPEAEERQGLKGLLTSYDDDDDEDEGDKERKSKSPSREPNEPEETSQDVEEVKSSAKTAGGGGVHSEKVPYNDGATALKALNHVPKRLKTSVAA